MTPEIIQSISRSAAIARDNYGGSDKWLNMYADDVETLLHYWEQAEAFILALSAKAPGVTFAGNPKQYVDSVIYNHIEDRLNKCLPDSLNRSLEERIAGLLDRANREADIAVRLRVRCEELKPGSSSDIG